MRNKGAENLKGFPGRRPRSPPGRLHPPAGPGGAQRPGHPQPAVPSTALSPAPRPPVPPGGAPALPRSEGVSQRRRSLRSPDAPRPPRRRQRDGAPGTATLARARQTPGGAGGRAAGAEEGTGLEVHSKAPRVGVRSPQRRLGPRTAAPARGPPAASRGSCAHRAFPRPGRPPAAPASGSGCGSRAPGPSAGPRGWRRALAAGRPEGRSIVAAAAGAGALCAAVLTRPRGPSHLPPSLPPRAVTAAALPPLPALLAAPGGGGRGAERGARLRGLLRAAPRPASPPTPGGAARRRVSPGRAVPPKGRARPPHRCPRGWVHTLDPAAEPPGPEPRGPGPGMDSENLGGWWGGGGGGGSRRPPWRRPHHR